MPAPATAQPSLDLTRDRSRAWLATLRADSAYVLTGWITSVVGFGLLVPLFAAGSGTAVLGLGFPILALTLVFARGFAVLERSRLRALTGVEPVAAVYKRLPRGAPLARLWTVLSDGRRWLDLLYGVFGLIPALAVFPVAVAWWALAVGGVLYPLYDWTLPLGPDNETLPMLIGLGDGGAVRIGLSVTIGVVAALTLPFVMRMLAMLLSSFGRAMLTRQRASVLAERVTELTDARAAAASAEAGALRKLERDLHDGPQQRLVRLAMDLGSAQRRLRTDPDAAGPLISAAIEQTRETLDELRALSRGIAPPVLADRGLAAALASLAARCPVPVSLDTGRAEVARLSPSAQNAAYFVVAEALTNVAKHSGAHTATVRVSSDEQLVRVVVTDDGAGGAHPAKGHGLAGLTDRVRALDGHLAVHSPAGGPTVLVAELPGAGSN